MRLRPERARAELTQFAVNAASESMFTISPEGMILDANPTACERLEYSRSELVGLMVWDVDPLHPVDLWTKHFEQLRRDRKALLETQHRSKSGRVYDVEVSVAYFEFENVEYCCASVRDLTKRKQAENLLRLQREILTDIATSSRNLRETLTELCRHVEQQVPGSLATVMLVDDTDGLLRFGAGPSLTPEVCQAFEPVDPAIDTGSCGAAAFLKRPVIVCDTRVSPHWEQIRSIVTEFNLLACWSLPVFDEQKNVLGTFAISHQRVSKPSKFQSNLLETASSLASIAIRRDRAEDQLRRAHSDLAHFGRLSMMGEMASSISHELNQPLAALVNEAYVFKLLSGQTEPDVDELRKHATNIHEQVMRASNIVCGMRDLAKKLPPTRRQVQLTDLMSKSLLLVEPELRQRGIAIEERYDAVDVYVDVDQVQIQQVLVNLVRNAIEAMRETEPGKRVLSITTCLANQCEVEFQVGDTGTGVLHEDLEHVFAPVNTTKENGMGMGLAISRSIARAHTGRLTVQNRETEGAVFSLFLPISNTDGINDRKGVAG